MTTLRVGTRGSDLALTQTRWFCDRLRAVHSGLEIEEIIIRTHGDEATDKPFDASWPVGSFVSALEQALVERRVDFAVHSYKDLPSVSAEGLVIAAVPGRESVHDVLVVREPMDLDHLPRGFRVGTSSPRRSAQFRRFCAGIEIVPIRGNVPRRLAQIDEGNADGVVLAAAGLRRLGIQPKHSIELPTDRFVPSPAQGALAVQTRHGEEAEALIGALDETDARRAVVAERSFLARVEAGCQTPLGALATIQAPYLELRAQLYDGDGVRWAEDFERGEDPQVIGHAIADRLLAKLNPS
jgi:hydroxymethylbilane synthase